MNKILILYTAYNKDGIVLCNKREREDLLLSEMHETIKVNIDALKTIYGVVRVCVDIAFPSK